MNYTETGLQHISPTSVDFDKNNPRGESASQITNDPEFGKLKISINEFGILEPLIVKRDDNNTGRFILIDGERRLRAALANKATLIPTIIATSQANGRILAYQIHKLRKAWTKISEVKSIKSIIKDIRKENSTLAPNEIKREILKITGMKSHEAEDLIKLARYEDKIIAAAINGELSMSYLIQIESNFISPIGRKFSQVLLKFDEDKIRQIMVDKAIKGKLNNTRYLMDTFKEVFNSYSPHAESVLTTFLHDKNMDIESAFNWFKGNIGKPNISTPQQNSNVADDGNHPAVAANTSQKTVSSPPKASSASTVGANNGASSKSTKIGKPQSNAISLEKVRREYENKIAGTLSEIEYQYVMEAITCLEQKCFKAAVLMIWAALIARIHKNIEKYLGDFNAATNEMKKNPKSVYKYYASSFIANVQNMDLLKQNSNDMQLFCYLFYKKIISDTQFKKMKANYDKRCDCAHPTDITLTNNEIVAIFENALAYIFANKALQ